MKQPHTRAAIGRGLLVLCAAVLPWGVAGAQDQSMEEIIITGSRIARDPGNYVGPMTMIDGQKLEQISTYNLNDLLQRIPAIGGQGITKNNSNGGNGFDYVEIHNLEVERTLVLLNGRRMVNSILGAQSLGVDMQAFPVNMIERIEVLADGASAVYGSDAIAGAINIITKSDFEGFELTAQASTPQDSGGDSQSAGAMWGVTGSRGFFTAGISFNRQEEIDYQDRDWSRVPILGQFDGADPGDPPLILSLMGSGIPPEGRQPDAGIIFKPGPNGASYQNYDTFCLGPLGDGTGSIDCILDLGHRFNYNEGGVSLVNGSTAVSGTAIGEWQFEAGVTGYVEILAAQREYKLNFTPLPIADSHGRWPDMIPVPANNPNVPADALAVIQAAQCSDADGNPIPGCVPPDSFQMWWRGLDAGRRKFDGDADTFKSTTGFRGDLDLFSRDWNWDTWFTMGRSEYTEITDDQVNVTKLRIAMDPVQCALDADCPKVNVDNQADYPGLAIGDPTLNIFGRAQDYGRTPISQAEKDWILFTDTQETEYEMYHLGGTLAGDLFELPAGSVGFAGGLEWRKESGGVTPSGVTEAGDSGGNFSGPTDGDYDLWEAYAEFEIPLLEDLPLISELDLSAAIRYSDYETFGNETTYKVALSYAPIDTLRFRGVVSTGFRAPNVLELYGGKADNYLAITDPCSGLDASNTDQVTQNCLDDGVPDGFIVNASQLRVSEGGNPDLEAEESDNYSVGLVWTPAFIEGLRVAIDYYNVEVENAISTPDAVAVLDRCYDADWTNGQPAECDRIDRGATGTITRFDLQQENLNSIETDGVDINATYIVDTGIGQLSIDLLLNYLNEWKQTSQEGAVDDRTGQVAGIIAEFAAYPEWKGNVTVGLSRDRWGTSLTWRYLDSMEVFDAIGVGTLSPEVSSTSYFDLAGSYQITDAFELRAGIENLTDEEPPYVPDTSNNTSGVYDYFGRVYYAGFKLNFE